jgi:hypothetical protein
LTASRLQRCTTFYVRIATTTHERWIKMSERVPVTLLVHLSSLELGCLLHHDL